MRCALAAPRLVLEGAADPAWRARRQLGRHAHGAIGSIDAAHFANEKYRFGMFTYLQGDSDSGQEFEVINYWVE